MPVTRKPKDEPALQRALSEDPEFQQYLSKGGSAAKTLPEAPKDVRFTLHIPGPLCQELDRLREARPLKISRHQWVLEAILEKIQREGSSGLVVTEGCGIRASGQAMQTCPSQDHLCTNHALPCS